MLTTTIARDPFADGTLVLDGTELGALTIRSTTGALNNLDDIHPNFGAAGQPFIRLTPQEFEDGINAEAGVAPAGGVRQPIGLFNADEVADFQARGFTVVTQAEAAGLGFSLDPLHLSCSSTRPIAPILARSVLKSSTRAESPIRAPDP